MTLWNRESVIARLEAAGLRVIGEKPIDHGVQFALVAAHKIGRQWKFKLSEVDARVRAGGATEEPGSTEGHAK
jgi:hypothetical protein